MQFYGAAVFRITERVYDLLGRQDHDRGLNTAGGAGRAVYGVSHARASALTGRIVAKRGINHCIRAGLYSLGPRTKTPTFVY